MLASLVFTACGDKPDAPPPGRGINGTQPMAAGPTAATDDIPSQPSAAYVGQGQAAPNAPTEANKPDAGKRDYGRELHDLAAGALSCIKPRAANEAKSFDLHVLVNITPSGAVSRGEASASLLDADELGCVRRSLETLHFALPIDNAPLVVQTSITINPQATAGATPQPADTAQNILVPQQAPDQGKSNGVPALKGGENSLEPTRAENSLSAPAKDDTPAPVRDNTPPPVLDNTLAPAPPENTLPPATPGYN